MLVACAEAPRYGYQVSSWLAAEGLVTGPVSAGRLYETLAALAREGALRVTDEPGDKGPARRRYHLTGEGQVRLGGWAASLQRSAAVLARLLARMAALEAANLPRVQDQHDDDTSEGGETMPCQCNCGEATPRADRAPSESASASAPARSVEERLDTIEALLAQLAAR